MEKANCLGRVKTAEHVSAISLSWVALQIGKEGIDTEVENVLTGCTKYRREVRGGNHVPVCGVGFVVMIAGVFIPAIITT